MSSYLTQASDAEKIRHNWGWLLAVGIGLAILGLVALVFTVTTTKVSVVLLGIVLLIGGVVVIVSAFTAGGIGGAILRVLLGIVLLAGGWYLMTQPAVGALAVTIVMAWYFIIAGIIRVISAMMERYDGWGWSVATGLVTLLLGILLTAGWPVTGTFAIGLFIGIDLILGGISWIVAAFAARTYTPTLPAPTA